MSHIAFDLGLHTSGIAWDGGSDHMICPNQFRKSPMTPQREHERFVWWRSTFAALLLPHPGADIVIEAPFIHAKHPSGSVNLILLHGILRGLAIDNGHHVKTVSPTVLKKWATGKGNATKEQMLDAARDLGWEGDDHNEADAFLLWVMFSSGREAAAA